MVGSLPGTECAIGPQTLWTVSWPSMLLAILAYGMRPWLGRRPYRKLNADGTRIEPPVGGQKDQHIVHVNRIIGDGHLLSLSITAIRSIPLTDIGAHTNDSSAETNVGSLAA